MFRGEKERINHESQRRYLFLRMAMGCKCVFTNPIKLLVLVAYLLSAFALWHYKDLISITEFTDSVNELITTLIQYGILAYAVVGFFFLLVLFGTPLRSKSTHDNFRRIGLVNSVGEAPSLLTKRKYKANKKVIIMEFISNGIPLNEWEDKRQRIETALNIHVAKVANGKNKRRTWLYTVPAKNGLSKLIHWNDKYLSKETFMLVIGESFLGNETVDLSKNPHLLLGGSTGSGKSVLLKLLVMQCIKKGAEVHIADFKGGVDFPAIWHNKCQIIIEERKLLTLLETLVDELNRRQSILNESDYRNIDEYNQKTGNDLKRLVFACDEVAEVLDKTGLDKDQKELVTKIESKLSRIARVGRACGIHLILSTQRPDANILSGQIKNNIDFRICGRADNVLSQIILDSASASEQIPKDAQGRFITHDGVVFEGYLFDDRRAFDNIQSKNKVVK